MRGKLSTILVVRKSAGKALGNKGESVDKAGYYPSRH